MDMFHRKDAYHLDANEFDVRHVLRSRGDRLGYVYDLGDSWKHILTVVDVVDRDTTLNASTLRLDPDIAAFLDKNSRDSWTVTGNHLLAGEINCPPEDSNDCDGMGDYASLLNRGRHYKLSAPTGVNWIEHGIRNAFKFDLRAHQKRFQEAISQRPSPEDGHLTFMHRLGDLGGRIPQDFFGSSSNRTTLHGHTSHPDATESVRTNPIPKDRCASCGKQRGTNSSVKLFDCSRCHGIAYCGRECQRKDWKRHKKSCVPN